MLSSGNDGDTNLPSAPALDVFSIHSCFSVNQKKPKRASRQHMPRCCSQYSIIIHPMTCVRLKHSYFAYMWCVPCKIQFKSRHFPNANDCDCMTNICVPTKSTLTNMPLLLFQKSKKKRLYDLCPTKNAPDFTSICCAPCELQIQTLLSIKVHKR
jgi:hypothetical protein